MSERLRLLIVEDSKDDAELLVQELTAAGHDVQFLRVETGEGMRDALASQVWDAIIADYVLPNFDGHSALTVLKESGLEIPFVVVSGMIGEERAVEMMREGADDYLLKDRMSRLVPAVEMAIRHATERRERVQAEERLRLSYSVLDALSRSSESVVDILGQILDLVQNGTGAETAAIRLKKGDDYPFFMTRGFGPDFLREACLLSSSPTGEAAPGGGGCSDPNSACWRVLNGATDVMEPGFTAAGSYWSDVAQEGEGGSPSCQRCRQEGFRSVALIPIRSEDSVIGLLQLCDRHAAKFSQELVQALEGLQGSVGIAIAQERARAIIREMAKFPAENPSPVMRVDFSGNLLYVNDSGKKNLSDWDLQIGKRVPPKVSEMVSMAVSGPRQRVCDVQYHDRTFLFYLAPVVHSGYVNLYGNDVTEYRFLQEQLRQSQKLEALGKLAGGIAHDFNNILMIIMGYCELMQERAQEDIPSVEDDLAEIMACAERATALTRQLLAFSRKQALKMEVLNLNELVTSLIEMLGRLIGENIEFSLHLDEDLGEVRADRAQLEQVLMNLVLNARDAMPGGGALEIRTTNVGESYADPDEPPGRVLLTVTDTGMGMEKETLEHCFEPFFTTKEKGKGTGLGLSMVYGIVKQSGGDIRVRSQKGEGTTFEIFLPVASLGEVVATPEVRPAELFRARGERALVVEDEQSIRALLARELSDLGFDVALAGDGEEALMMAREQGGQGLTLVVSDVIMPGMSGVELVQGLRGIHPELRALLISGYLGEGVDGTGFWPSGERFLQKPFSKKQLSEAIQALFGS